MINMPKIITNISYHNLIVKQNQQISVLMNHCDQRNITTTGVWCKHSGQEAIRQCQQKYCPFLRDGYLYKDGE